MSSLDFVAATGGVVFVLTLYSLPLRVGDLIVYIFKGLLNA